MGRQSRGAVEKVRWYLFRSSGEAEVDAGGQEGGQLE